MRRRVTLVFAFGLIITACSPDSETATSSTDTATSTMVTTSTTTGQQTTTTGAVSTTSTSVPATTTTVESTTSTTEETGTWADLPLVVAGFGALGWWDGSDWVSAEDAGELPVIGGESYQIAGIGLEATTTGGKQTLVCEPLNNLGVQLQNEQLLGDWPGPYGVAVSAPWVIQPNLFEAFEDDGTYSALASSLLADRGLDIAQPVIKQLFRTDLEGDGTNEVLVVAEDLPNWYLPEAGAYSIAFMRKVIQGDVQTAVLGATAITDSEGAFVVGYSIGSVADLSGDSRMEIVVSAAYYEGLAVEVWEYVDDDIGPFKYLEAGCGS